jgi:hypothetical protein
MQWRDLDQLLTALRSKAPGQWSQNVFELSRHFTSATFLALNTLATHASDSTFSVVERVDDPDAPNGEVELPWYDPVHQFFENPNPNDTFSDLMYQAMQQKGLTGMAMAWTPPAETDDEPAEMYVLPTANCWPLPASPDFPHGAYRVLPYPFGLLSAPIGQIAAGAIIPAEQVTRIKNHHPYLRYDGYAILTAISQQVDTLEAIDVSRNTTMQQGCEQTLALEAVAGQIADDPSEEDVKRLRKQFELLYAGPKNSGKLLLPPRGWKVSQVSTVPRDMAWQEGWSQILDFVLAGFGVPKAVAGLQEAVSYATLYSSLRAFCLFSLGPNVRQVNRGWNKHIVHPAWGRRLMLKIAPPEFVDETLEETKLANDLKCGAILYREYRKRRGYDAIDEPWVNDRAYATFNPAGEQPAGPDGGEGGKDAGPESGAPMLNDPHVDNARPTKSVRAERLAIALERAKTNGHAKPIKD